MKRRSIRKVPFGLPATSAFQAVSWPGVYGSKTNPAVIGTSGRAQRRPRKATGRRVKAPIIA